MGLAEELEAQGWHISDAAIERCTEGLEKPTAKDVIKKALDLDFKDIGAPCIPEDINRGKVSSIPGNLVLMVTKIRNLTAPKVKEESSAGPRMLKISLTDGTSTCHGVEFSKLDRIGLSTPPGSKIRLKGTSLPVVGGFIKLDNKSIELLGGQVDHLIEKWKLSEELAYLKRTGVGSGGAEGPPKWIPFGQKLSKHKDLQVDREKEKERSLKERIEPVGDDDFSSQRKDAIQEAAKGEQKKFGGGTKQIADSRSKRSQEKEQRDRGEKEKPDRKGDTDREEKGRKGKGRRERDSEPSSAPSKAVSLFDFLEEKIPEPKEKTPVDKPKSESREKDKSGRQEDRREDRRGEDRGGRGGRGGGRGGRGGGGGGGGRDGGGNSDKSRDSKFSKRTPKDRETAGRDNRDGGRGGRDDREGGRGGRDDRDGGRGGRDDRLGNFQGKNPGSDPVFVHGKSSNRASDSRPDKFESEMFSDTRPPRFSKEARHSSQKDQQQWGGENGLDRSKGGRMNGDQSKSNDQGHRNEHRSRKNDNSARNNESNFKNNEQDVRSNGHNYRGNDQSYNSVRKDHQKNESRYNSSANFSDHVRNGHPPEISGRNGHVPDNTYDSRRDARNGNLTAKFDQMNLDAPTGGGRGGYSANGVHSYPQQSTYHQFNRPPPNYGKQADSFLPQAESAFGAPPGNPSWRQGDQALAKYWEDNQFYPVVITAVGQGTAVVLFTEYGNHEEVFFSDLRPVKGGRAGKGIPPTPGLPPAFKQ